MLEATDQGNEASAETELRKASELDPKDGNPHMLLAALLEKKGDLRGAEGQLIAAKDAAPKNLQTRVALSSLYLNLGEKDKSEQTLRDAVQDLQDSNLASQVLVDFYAKTGQMDRAATVFQELNSTYPKNPAIKLTYARILVDRGENAKQPTW